MIKCLAFQLTDRLSLSPNCTHLKSHGGLKATVRNVQQHLKHYRYVLKTDVRDFYASIDHDILLEQLAKEINSRVLLNYLWQVIRRTVEAGGNFWDITTGISRGCSISPILGALYLKILDERLTSNKWYYVRYMDDILVLSKTRWHNRQAIKVLNQVFEQLKLAKHPDKTFIGRIERGFDFLGYHFSLEPLKLAQQTIRKHAQHIIQLYEQQKTKKATSEEMAFVLGTYVRRWRIWCNAGLGIGASAGKYTRRSGLDQSALSLPRAPLFAWCDIRGGGYEDMISSKRDAGAQL